MGNRRLTHLVLMALVIGLIAGACSSNDSTDTTMADDMDMSGDHTYSFGEPTMAAEATRVIEVSATDDFRFEPDRIMVSAGEVVTFKVTNDGEIPHDFVLGDVAAQDAHEEAMQNMTGDDSMSHEDPNAFVVKPGETRVMTWRMTEAGEILMGCHQPGHYVSGMKGIIEIEG
jgi:uncharacterized cupredoxin-like copper-binding protein